MRKITLLAATALTIAGLGSQPMVAQAAPQVYFAYGSECNIQSILEQLANCFPSVNLPGISCPEDNAPETNLPENNAPETNVPENNTPEVNVPGSTPEDNNPGNGGTEDIKPDETPEEDSSDNIHAYVKEVIDLVNAERAKEGLGALTMDLQVQAAAQVRAMECEQRFSHTRPNGTSFATALKEQNVSYRRAGENIAWGQRNPQTVVNAWMNSEGHRANIMNPNFTTIGVGYYQNANGTNYWCQLFTN